MKDSVYRYSVIPGVLPVGEKREITISANDTTWRFTDDNVYDVKLYAMSYRQSKSVPCVEYKITAKDRKLKFTYKPEREDEYAIVISRNGNVRCELSLYALENDLYSLTPLKGDFHVHTNYSDGLDSPGVAAAHYRSAGFDFMAVTDHANYSGSLEMIRSYENFNVPMLLAPGEEVHAPDNYVHIVNFGGNESVNDIYKRDKDAYYREVEKIIASSDIELEDEFTYASSVWVARQIRRVGGMAVLCHPKWIYDYQYNQPDSLTRALLLSGEFDAFELLGGQTAHENNLQTAMWQQLRCEGADIPILGASDAHGTFNRGLFDKIYSIVYSRENTVNDIKSAVTSSKACAVEVYADSKNYTVYGNYRLVCYTRYLIETYFSYRELLTAPQGVCMDRYISGNESAKEIISVLSRETDNYYKSFFGR